MGKKKPVRPRPIGLGVMRGSPPTPPQVRSGGGANFLVDLPSTGGSQGLMNDGVKQRKG